MSVLKKIGDALDRVCGVLIVLMVGAMVLITTAQIIWRVGSGIVPGMHPLSWSEEVTRFLLIWATFLGATCVYRRGGNIAITAVQQLFPERVQRCLRAAVHAICFVLFALLLYYGVTYCNKQVRTAAALPIKMKYIYMCLPISMCVMMYMAFVMALSEIVGWKEAK